MINSTKIKKLPAFSDRISREVDGICPADGFELTREGTGVSPGIVIGRVFIFDAAHQSVPQYRIKKSEIHAEQQRFLNAVDKTLKQLDSVSDKTKDAFEGDPLSSLFDVYRHMLKGSRLIRGVMHRIKDSQLNAEMAVKTEISAIADVFRAMDDIYISARIEDIRSVGARLLRNLQSDAIEKSLLLPENAVIIADELNVADTVLLNLKNFSAFVTTGGSEQSHSALMARSLGIPAVVNVPDILRIAQTGDIIIIDGTYGKVILCPSQENIDLYRKYRSDFLRWKRSLKRLRSQPSVTTDNVSVTLKANVDLPNELDFLMQTGTDGIGLLRSEYIFMNRDSLPDENQHFEILAQIMSRMEGRPVTFRTFDVGGDKCPSALRAPSTGNSCLGLRGIRFALKTVQVLKTQFRAVLRASCFGDIRILLPMVTSVEEIEKSKALLAECAAELRNEGVALPDALPQVGIMIETPAAALEAGYLASFCDFFSIGTNDLIQYTLAADRSDSSMATMFTPLHSSILKLLKMTIDAANSAGIPVCICGEIAANHRYTAILVGLGARELSMPAINIPMVKERIRSLNIAETERYANRLLSLAAPDDIRQTFTAFEEGVRF